MKINVNCVRFDFIIRWIITAAHCLPPGLEIKAFFGISSTGRYSTKIVVPPSNQHIYPQFNEKTFQHDIGKHAFYSFEPFILYKTDKKYSFFAVLFPILKIALLELPTPITFDHYIRPVNFTDICLTPHMGGKTVTAAGTGRTKLDEKASDWRLRHAHFTTMSSEFCSSQLHYKLNPNSIICGNVDIANNQSIYNGDSGI